MDDSNEQPEPQAAAAQEAAPPEAEAPQAEQETPGETGLPGPEAEAAEEVAEPETSIVVHEHGDIRYFIAPGHIEIPSGEDGLMRGDAGDYVVSHPDGTCAIMPPLAFEAEFRSEERV